MTTRRDLEASRLQRAGCPDRAHRYGGVQCPTCGESTRLEAWVLFVVRRAAKTTPTRHLAESLAIFTAIGDRASTRWGEDKSPHNNRLATRAYAAAAALTRELEERAHAGGQRRPLSVPLLANHPGLLALRSHLPVRRDPQIPRSFEDKSDEGTTRPLSKENPIMAQTPETTVAHVAESPAAAPRKGNPEERLAASLSILASLSERLGENTVKTVEGLREVSSTLANTAEKTVQTTDTLKGVADGLRASTDLFEATVQNLIDHLPPAPPAYPTTTGFGGFLDKAQWVGGRVWQEVGPGIKTGALGALGAMMALGAMNAVQALLSPAETEEPAGDPASPPAS